MPAKGQLLNSRNACPAKPQHRFLFASRMMQIYRHVTKDARLNEIKNWLIADREAGRGL
jgi:hypothetical protein